MAEISNERIAEQSVGKTVYDLMMSIDSMDCDIVSEGGFTYPSLVEFGRDNLTEEGHKVWDDILKKYTVKSYGNNRGYITFYVLNLNDEEDYGEDLNNFEYMLAGYVACSKFDAWVNHN